MPAPPPDWLSQFLSLVTVTGQLEIRCAMGAPWAVVYEQSAEREIPYHLILNGRAILEDPAGKPSAELNTGDIVLLPHGSAHTLRDGSGQAPMPNTLRASGNVLLGENNGPGARLDMLCGRFHLAPPYDRLIKRYLPTSLIVRTLDRGGEDARPAAGKLTGLVELMRAESLENGLGGTAVLNALSSALFALTLRAASESNHEQAGLLALAAQPKLTPALCAMLDDPAHPWTLPELAGLCNMSRATFMRHFQSTLNRSATDLLTDIRMSLAAGELRKPGASTEAIASEVGYQSVAAFRRVFSQWMGMTPGEWRRQPPPAEPGFGQVAT